MSDAENFVLTYLDFHEKMCVFRCFVLQESQLPEETRTRVAVQAGITSVWLRIWQRQCDVEARGGRDISADQTMVESTIPNPGRAIVMKHQCQHCFQTF